MQAAIDHALGHGPSVPLLYVQVTSDSIITPQLLALNLASSAKHRPPWGAGLIYQLLRRERDQFFVRVIYNGEDQAFMEFDEFVELVRAVRPSRADVSLASSTMLGRSLPTHTTKAIPLHPPGQCERFFDNYEEKGTETKTHSI